MNNYKTLYQGQVGATAAAVFTALFPTRITTLNAVNVSGTDRALELWIGGSDDENALLDATTLDANGGRVELDGELKLEKGEALYAKAAAASAITLTILGEVFT